ncbi:hypothetical protein [Actinacidiphila acididurans]|uniref:Prohead protease n=1 Tax=Actinacidiphila acididurans TaxID=2784346 RepID=A0ABS2U306_9ACTN|nr:hypothetical protein [Actinacidiphila acididurans]MBM9509985.1 hypothetical protein [Actinacidiphila acididurans]
MSDTAYAWAPITKTVREDDGTLLVYGPAASSALDRDQQRLDGTWLDQAMPRWLAEGGGVREQHDPKRAVGVGVGLSKGDDGAHLLTARIVDPVAVKKIEHGVLRGFSVGIKAPRVEMGKADAPNGLVVGGDVIEVSVVDRPANPGCTFDLAKADSAGDLILVEDAEVTEKTDAEAFGLPQELYDRLAAPVKEALTRLADGGAQVSVDTAKTDDPGPAVALPTFVIHLQGAPVTEEMLRGLVDARVEELSKADLSAAGRRKAASSGAAMNDGSYPIETKADLRKAIRAVGRGGVDHDKIRAHIIKRAKALGLSDMIPENWKADGSMTTTKADEATIAKAEQILTDILPLVPGVAKADDGGTGGDGGDGGNPDESMDIEGAQQALAGIAKLIIAEAESLAEGNVNEIIDISLLLDAARSLKWFQDREEREQAGMAEDMCLSDKPDATKTDKAPPAAASGPSGTGAPGDGTGTAPGGKAAKKADGDGALLTKAEAAAAVQTAVAEALAARTPQTAPADEPDTVTKADLADMVKAAVAEATKAAEERAAALAADVAKASVAEAVKDLPTPGGPVLTRTAAQQSTAAESDAARMRAEGDALMAKADQFAANRDLAEGYRIRAKALYARAGA